MLKSYLCVDAFMEGSLRLGGNIELFGVESIDGASMVVLKKIVGTYARKFSEKGLESLAVAFDSDAVRIEAKVQGSVISGQASHSNKFFALDGALKEVQKQL